MKKNTMTYSGFYQDTHGMTVLGRVVLDGWLFGFIPESEDCKGWDMARMQVLMNRVEAAWDQHGNLPSRLPPELRERHTELYARATERAQGHGCLQCTHRETRERTDREYADAGRCDDCNP